MHTKSLLEFEALRIPEGIASQWAILGITYTTRKEYDPAEAALLKAVTCYQELGRNQWGTAALANLTRVYEERGDLAKMEESIGKMEHFATRPNEHLSLPYMRDLRRHISDVATTTAPPGHSVRSWKWVASTQSLPMARWWLGLTWGWATTFSSEHVRQRGTVKRYSLKHARTTKQL